MSLAAVCPQVINPDRERGGAERGRDGLPAHPTAAPLTVGAPLSAEREANEDGAGDACTIDLSGQVRLGIYRPTNWLMRPSGSLLLVDVGRYMREHYLLPAKVLGSDQPVPAGPFGRSGGRPVRNRVPCLRESGARRSPASQRREPVLRRAFHGPDRPTQPPSSRTGDPPEVCGGGSDRRIRRTIERELPGLRRKRRLRRCLRDGTALVDLEGRRARRARGERGIAPASAKRWHGRRVLFRSAGPGARHAAHGRHRRRDLEERARPGCHRGETLP